MGIYTKLKSYFKPINLRHFHSEYNGKLELLMLEGKVYLDSENTNYSYGSLEKILEFGLKKLEQFKPKNCLILGFGAGSVLNPIHSLLGDEIKIDAIEIDPEIIKIAKDHFNIYESSKLKIIKASAQDIAQILNQPYELLIIDLFIDNKIPEFLHKVDYWNTLRNYSTENAKIVFNAGIRAEDKEKSLALIPEINSYFDLEKFEDIEGSNLLFILSRKNGDASF